ncbi:Uncharacterised protein [Legionella lansingensis]|uniref:Uncharacterized protein n=1 Tax=Legionella lansingensis TaxID=45067 RepID=A0A0W0V7P3_9GAMM|nr:hypothetical protein [Legionella lansingensis]KTD15894.1 hypothetical protein Llan_2629 [Legionella lansingensis]SNV47639.1 Uncharacterised protein [Legionella lansingensis]
MPKEPKKSGAFTEYTTKKDPASLKDIVSKSILGNQTLFHKSQEQNKLPEELRKKLETLKFIDEEITPLRRKIMEDKLVDSFIAQFAGEYDSEENKVEGELVSLDIEWDEDAQKIRITAENLYHSVGDHEKITFLYNDSKEIKEKLEATLEEAALNKAPR